MDTRASIGTSTKSIWIVGICLAAAQNAAGQDSSSSSEAQLPFPDYEAYTDSLRRDDDYYVLKDQAYSKAELDRYFELLEQGRLNPIGNGTLVANLTVDGQLDYWRDFDGRRLTYSVDVASFSTPEEIEAVRSALAHAAYDWYAICTECGISITHDPRFDDYASPYETTFVVRKVDSPNYATSSFYPSSQPDQRYLDLSGEFFFVDTEVQVGLIRHEFGHILGYAHNPLTSESCSDELPLPTKGETAAAQSIMNFPCGDAFYDPRSYEISREDIQSHRRLYGPGTLIIDTNEPGHGLVLNTLEIVAKTGLLAPALGTNDEFAICTMFLTAVGLQIDADPRECRQIQALAENLAAAPGRQFRFVVPDVVVSPKEQYRTFVPGPDGERELREFEKTHGVLHVEEERHGYRTAYWETYQIVIPLTFESIVRVEEAITILRNQLPVSTDVQSERLDSMRPNAPTIFFGNALDPLDYYARCRAQSEIPAPAAPDDASPDFGSYVKLAGADPARLPACAVTPCQGDDCAKLVLVDTRVKLNPDIASAVIAGAEPAPPGTPLSDLQCPPITEFRQDEHHGTHLAGIMVSQNRFFGVGRSAQLISRVRTNASNAELQRMVQEEGRANRRVFVFASNFDYEPTDRMWLEGPPEQYTDADVRARARLKNGASLEQSLPRPALEIWYQTSVPWIVAIGQPNGSGTPITIDDRAAFSPANLAARANVIVVTACVDCTSASPKVWDGANYGTGDRIAHIAAPGGINTGGIPATASWNGYYAAYGTSQAAAFIGGLAGAMTTCYPEEYARNAIRLKQWLQVTATPIHSHESADRVATGVVDVERALLDPTKTYSQLELGDPRTHEPSAVKWCADDLDFSRGAAVEDTIQTSDIFRITKTDYLGNKAWIVYTNDNNNSSRVVRHGPYTGVENTGPIVRVEDQNVELAQIEDLLLSRSLVLEGPTDCVP